MCTTVLEQVASGIPGEATRLKTMLGNPPNVVPLTLDVVSRFFGFFRPIYRPID